MNTPRPIARFFGWARARAPEVAVPDAADMGTAFGLDMCQPEPATLPASLPTVPARRAPDSKGRGKR